MSEFFWTGVRTTLACMGGIWLGLECYKWAKEKWQWYKLHKQRKHAQKKRLAAYATGDRRPAPIMIAKDFANGLTKAAPVRKATGLFSDEAAQAILK